VIPRWTAALLEGSPVKINGDGETSRDFCYVANAVQANLLAATTTLAESKNQVYNVAAGGRTTLNTLFELIKSNLSAAGIAADVPAEYGGFRAGDVRHSQADIGKAQQLLGYQPSHQIGQGIQEAMGWYTGQPHGEAG
jgi:UDP-N-acetylglucosamine 4-epimerase